ncbi:hypothetical protein ACFPPA_16285 [Rhodanobacter ginsengisoli]|uniref:Uncharacterized protein n=1 Tax=Rhodanobacter ginsengisoli TaxID=418646 RepID=A0ABW0QRB3_9GAMM
MRKTLFAVYIAGACMLTAPAFAQVNLGGAAQVGAGVNAGVAVPPVAHTLDQAGARTGQTLHRTARHATDLTRKTADRGRAAVDAHGNTAAQVRTAGTLDAGAAGRRASEIGHAVSHRARRNARSAARSGEHAARRSGKMVSHATSGPSVEADARVNADVDAHGH